MTHDSELVERYDFDLMDQRMVRDRFGPWVRYSDYESLRARLAEAERKAAESATIAMHKEAELLLEIRALRNSKA